LTQKFWEKIFSGAIYQESKRKGVPPFAGVVSRIWLKNFGKKFFQIDYFDFHKEKATPYFYIVSVVGNISQGQPHGQSALEGQ